MQQGTEEWPRYFVELESPILQRADPLMSLMISPFMKFNSQMVKLIDWQPM
jgi:hypothetical protein